MLLASLTRFWHLWREMHDVVIPPEGPSWEQVRRLSRGEALGLGLGGAQYWGWAGLGWAGPGLGRALL